jgi:aromatic-L-amino-acid decarboxylase
MIVKRPAGVYISNARIGDAFALRACIVNHRTTKEDIQSVIDEVLASAEEV